VSERFTRSAAGDAREAVDGGLDRPPTLTRGQLVARAAVGAGAVTAVGVVAGGLPRLAVSEPSREQDRSILEWLLQVEYVQAAFYEAVERQGALQGEPREFAARVGRQERAHVDALKGALGPGAPERPEFDFGDATSDPGRFVETAVELEELAVAAFNGQIPNLTRPRVMMAMRIVSVEARHVGWVRDLAGRNPAPQPADRAATPAETRAALEATGFKE
jgi:Ferritin-like domain